VKASVFEYADSVLPSDPFARQKYVPPYASEPSDIIVWPSVLTGTVTTAASWLKSAVVDTSKKYTTSPAPSIAPLTTKKSGLVLFSLPAGAIAVGASIRAGVTTAGGWLTVETFVLAVDDGATGLAVFATSHAATPITAARTMSPRMG
jgi:hypothetical protein